MKKFAKSASFSKNYFLKVKFKLYERTIKILQQLTVIYQILQSFSKIYWITSFSQKSTSSTCMHSLHWPQHVCIAHRLAFLTRNAWSSQPDIPFPIDIKLKHLVKSWKDILKIISLTSTYLKKRVDDHREDSIT